MPVNRKFSASTPLPATPAEAFGWHARPGAFSRLSPPFAPADLVEDSGGIGVGARKVIAVRVGPVRLRWVALHTACETDRYFEDVQVSGPFAHWRHRHEFAAEGAGCRLTDRVEYRLPWFVPGVFAERIVEAQLRTLFAHRHAVTRADLELLAEHRRLGGGPMKILVSGSNGLVGSSLIPLLGGQGHAVTKLVRGEAKPGEIRWDPVAGTLDKPALDALAPDAIIHLAGDPIAEGRWTPEKKARIRDSRTGPTRLLAEWAATAANPPKSFIAASAIGYYGDRGGESLNEASPAGTGFLPDVCKEWEAACEPARRAGIRTVNLRFGVILSPAGGALKKMLLPFKLGGGGPLGAGTQWMSWIALDDALGAIARALADESLSGPVNVTAPGAVTNAEFTRTLGKVLRRPAVLPMPAFAARLAFGEVADALLLSSTKVEPARLQAAGYPFRHPQLEAALRHLLGR